MDAVVRARPRQQRLGHLRHGAVVDVDDVRDRRLGDLRVELVGVQRVQPVELGEPVDQLAGTDAPGVLSSLTSITARYGANITHVAVYRGHGDTSTVVVGMNSLNTDAIEADLAAEGFKVIAKLQNR